MHYTINIQVLINYFVNDGSFVSRKYLIALVAALIRVKVEVE